MKAIFSCLFLCIVKCSFASSFLSLPQDTIEAQKEYRLNEKGFVEKYGRDDSSKALIHFFFRKRNLGIGNFSSGIPLAIAGGIGVGNVSHTINNENGTFGTIGKAVLFAVLLGGGLAMLSVGTSLWSRYSRKRLLILLNNYFEGKRIPYGIGGNKLFKKFLWQSRRKDQ